MTVEHPPARDGPDVRTQLELLSQMVEEVSGELALEPLLARLVERACKLIGADDGAIGLYDAERDIIRTAASHAIPEAQLNAELPRGHGLTGRVLELGAPLRCRYGDLPHPSRAAALEMNMIGMPIRSRGELIGVFGIGAWPPKQLGDAEQELLEHFARHAAVAIVNARRYSDEQRRSVRFAMIARVAGIIASETGPRPTAAARRGRDPRAARFRQRRHPADRAVRSEHAGHTDPRRRVQAPHTSRRPAADQPRHHGSRRAHAPRPAGQRRGRRSALRDAARRGGGACGACRADALRGGAARGRQRGGRPAVRRARPDEPRHRGGASRGRDPQCAAGGALTAPGRAGGAPAARSRAARQRHADPVLDQPDGAVAERRVAHGIRATASAGRHAWASSRRWRSERCARCSRN